jgi:hypothetical protein
MERKGKHLKQRVEQVSSLNKSQNKTPRTRLVTREKLSTCQHSRHGVNSTLSIPIPIPLNSIWSIPIPIPHQICQFQFQNRAIPIQFHIFLYSMFTNSKKIYLWYLLYFHFMHRPSSTFLLRLNQLILSAGCWLLYIDIILLCIMYSMHVYFRCSSFESSIK